LTGKGRRRALAAGLSLAAVLALGELGARRALGAPWPEREPLLTVRANRLRGWEMVPGLHRTYDREVHVNRLGLRGPELAGRRPGERRVLVLGDSFVYGQGARDEETLPAFLEGCLAERSGADVTVVNGGHRAYAMHQELGLLRELGARIAPDDVVVLWFWNDTTENDLDEQFERLSASGPRPFDTGAPLEGWTRLRWRGFQLLRRSALLMWLRDALRETEHAGYAPMPVDEYVPRFREHVRAFRALAEEGGFRLWFAVIPDPFSLRRSERAPPHPSADVERRVLDVLRREEVAVIDLRAPLVAWLGDDPLPVIPFDGHYLPAANRALAAALAQALAE